MKKRISAPVTLLLAMSMLIVFGWRADLALADFNTPSGC